MAAMLKVAHEPMLKTHMMYAANLSFEQSQRYFNKLVSAGLIQKTDDKRWVATEKGRKFLQLFEELEMLCRLDLKRGP